MTLEEIKALTFEGIEERMAAIKSEIETADSAALDSLTAEMDAIEERRKELKIEQRKKSMLEVINGAGRTISTTEEERTDMNDIEVRASKEYKNAWLKRIAGHQLSDAEARTLTTGITGNTAGTATSVAGQNVLVPTEILNNIWNLIEQEHSIISGITTYRTNTVLELIQHTESSGASLVAEGVAPAEETNTFAKLVLAGKDFAKWLELTYAMDKMSLPALQSYIENEISAALGDLIAKDIVETIKGQTTTTDVADAGVKYADICKVLGGIKGKNITIYANRESLYGHFVSMVGTDGHPVFQLDPTNDAVGRILGCPVKIEDACEDCILFIDKMAVVNNIVQDIMLESERDIKTHKIIHSGYARMECGLVVPKATAAITFE